MFQFALADLRRRGLSGAWLLALAFQFPAWSAPPDDEVVLVTAVAESSPEPRIILSFPAGPLADTARTISGYRIHRKSRDAEDWKPLADNLPASTSSYTNRGADVKVGSDYEYRVTRIVQFNAGPGATRTRDLHSFIHAGIELPPEKTGYDTNHSRGKILLIVDSSLASSLAGDIASLEQDLAGDGWTVLRHNFPRGVEPNRANGSPNPAYGPQVKQLRNLIQEAYTADRTNVRAALLLGHLPVAYSGNQTPDGHAYPRAWPTDGYFGSVTNGTENAAFQWTDARQDFNAIPPFTARSSNHPGDGKFDNGSIPTPVRLCVGRVDLSDLPAFRETEADLLKRYLKKNHSYRNGLTRYDARALSLNQFPCRTRHWATFTTFFGREKVFDAISNEWFAWLGQGSFLWAYGSNYGDGNGDSAMGIGSTADFASKDARAVFMVLFGSFFGDWQMRNSLLRAPLGNRDTLTCSWHADDRCADGVSPEWVPPLFHHMAMGETIGYSVRLTQNYPATYRKMANMIATRPVHISLMGDPTLRLHVVAPPTGLSARPGADGSVALNWKASPEPPPALKGYFLYRAADPKGPFTLLNRTQLTGPSVTSFTDTSASSKEKWYMVRAAKLETSASGTYTNLSQGAFAQVK